MLIPLILLLTTTASTGKPSSSNLQKRQALPDFYPDSSYLAETLSLGYVNADEDPCLANEGCLNGPGIRRILRFGTKIHNIGPGDAILGQPPATIGPENPPYWHWDTCHQHWHYTAYASYDLLSPLKTPLVKGSKSGFCLEDFQCPSNPLPPPTSIPQPPPTILNLRTPPQKTYQCSYQGITSGCADVYDDSLPCQWIDVTEFVASPAFNVSETYWLRVAVNPNGEFPELDLANNVAWAPVVFGKLAEGAVET
ncbi:hypothetical protein HDU97_006173 [Phlyctochytrium planicorne]|nr:hypothetical protein HDU97_006173 [Phlyctochytrium planicorne]